MTPGKNQAQIMAAKWFFSTGSFPGLQKAWENRSWLEAACGVHTGPQSPGYLGCSERKTSTPCTYTSDNLGHWQTTGLFGPLLLASAFIVWGFGLLLFFQGLKI